jgi:hypothetical protein
MRFGLMAPERAAWRAGREKLGIDLFFAASVRPHLPLEPGTRSRPIHHLQTDGGEGDQRQFDVLEAERNADDRHEAGQG